MDFQITEKGSSVIFSLSGDFTYGDLKEFNDQIALLNTKKPELVEFDFSGLNFIDSMGLGLLIQVHDAGVKNGYRTVIKNARGNVLEVLENANFLKLFEMA